MNSIIERVISLDKDFGRGEKKGIKVNVEFVSANPTGDLHLGHARIAAVGDSICSQLGFESEKTNACRSRPIAGLPHNRKWLGASRMC